MTDTRKNVLPLTADLTPAELAEALGALRFRGPSRCLVSLDKDVRDYLLRALRARCRFPAATGQTLICLARGDDVPPAFLRRCLYDSR